MTLKIGDRCYVIGADEWANGLVVTIVGAEREREVTDISRTQHWSERLFRVRSEGMGAFGAPRECLRRIEDDDGRAPGNWEDCIWRPSALLKTRTPRSGLTPGRSTWNSGV